MIPPVYDDSDFPGRLARLLALEIDRIVNDLDQRRTFLIEIWSRHRDRGPFLDTVFSRYRTLSLTDLAVLSTEVVTVIESFYGELDDLKLYLSFTQDMPTTLAEQFTDQLRHIAAYGALAIEALGGVPERVVIEFEPEPEDGAEPPALPNFEVLSGDRDDVPGEE